MHVPRQQLDTYGRRAFAIVDTSAWNSLPDHICKPNATEATFKKRLCSRNTGTPIALGGSALHEFEHWRRHSVTLKHASVNV